MIARVFVMNINNADDLPATDQRNRQERFVSVFGQGCKGLKARVFPGSRRQRHNRLVFRYPSRYAYSAPQPDVATLYCVPELRRAQHNCRERLPVSINQTRTTTADPKKECTQPNQN